jgi:hypothetical protein
MFPIPKNVPYFVILTEARFWPTRDAIIALAKLIFSSHAKSRDAIIRVMHQDDLSSRIESFCFSPRNVGSGVIGLVIFSLRVWILVVMAALHDAARDLRTIDLSGLRTFQSEMTAFQHLANINPALQRNMHHQSANSKVPPGRSNRMITPCFRTF